MSESVIGIVFNDNKTEVLLIKRADADVWALPGGGIDPGETPEQAVVREILEETGFQTDIVNQSAEYHPVNALAKVTYTYVCKITGGNINQNAEVKETRFFPINKLPKTCFYIHKRWIEESLQTPPLIKRQLTEVNYFALIWYLLKHPVTFFRFLFRRRSD